MSEQREFFFSSSLLLFESGHTQSLQMHLSAIWGALSAATIKKTNKKNHKHADQESHQDLHWITVANCWSKPVSVALVCRVWRGPGSEAWLCAPDTWAGEGGEGGGLPTCLPSVKCKWIILRKQNLQENITTLLNSHSSRIGSEV